MSASFSSDGLRVVTVSENSTARAWNAHTGQPLGEPLGHGQGVVSASFSSDGLRVVTVSGDETAQVWDASTGLPLGEPLRHGQGVVSASFGSDGLRVITVSEDTTAQVWDATTGQPLGEPLRHESRFQSAELSPDGLRVFTVSRDNTARVWAVPSARSAAPKWFSDFLEAVGGARLESGAVRPGSRTQNDAARYLGPLEKSVNGETNVFLIVARWLISDRGTRTISPFSTTTIPTYAQRLVELGTLQSLHQAIRIEPTNGLAYARLARSEWTAATTAVSRGQAEFLSQYALKLTPQLPEAWSTHIFLLEAAGHPDQSLWVASNATVRFPENPEFWCSLGRFLARTNQLEDSLAALTKAVDLTATDPAQRGSHAEALEGRAAVFMRLGRQTEADRDLRDARGIPIRPAEVPAALLDLTRFYNAGLLEDWHNTNDVGNNLAELPTGLQEFGGIRWDVRGIIQLDSLQVAMTAPGYPKEVLGIGVGQRGLRLHFLHGCGWPGNEGDLVARYIIRYADGTSVEAPVVYGRDLRNWQFWPEMPESERSGGEVAWKGPQKRYKQFYPDWGVRLYRMTWENPHPEKEIATIDLVSAMRDSAVFIIAITVDPVDPN
jgi:tetratricopeptide (TPR) repeat protein